MSHPTCVEGLINTFKNHFLIRTFATSAYFKDQLCGREVTDIIENYRTQQNMTKYVLFHNFRRCRFDNSYWCEGFNWDDRQLTRTREHDEICFVSSRKKKLIYKFILTWRMVYLRWKTTHANRKSKKIFESVLLCKQKLYRQFV